MTPFKTTIKKALRTAIAVPTLTVPCSRKGWVRILTYHRTNPDIHDRAAVPPDVFDRQMRHLSENFKVGRLSELPEILSSARADTEGLVLVTFDDGYKDNYEVATPILEKYGIHATFFITSGHVGTKKRFFWDVRDNVDAPMMTWDMVQDLAARGHDIGAHTVTHADLGAISQQEAEREILGSKETIEDRLGTDVSLFAYPFGRRDNRTAAMSDYIRRNFSVCCVAERGLNPIPGLDLNALKRVSVQSWWGFLDFKAELRGGFDFIERFR